MEAWNVGVRTAQCTALRTAVISALAIVITACGGGSSGGNVSSPPTSDTPTPELYDLTLLTATSACSDLHFEVRSGRDLNGDGELNSDEGQSRGTVCAPGDTGDWDVESIRIAAGAQCVFGGHDVTLAQDQNQDGVITTSEVLHRETLCATTASAEPIRNFSTLSGARLTRAIRALGVNGTDESYAIANAPEHGVVRINSDGTFSYTPNNTYIGPDSFALNALNGDSRATFTITVNVTAAAPDAVVDLDARIQGRSSALLTWTADSGSQYELRQSSGPITENNWEDAEVVSIPANADEGALEVNNLSAETPYYFALRAGSGPLSNLAYLHIPELIGLELSPRNEVNEEVEAFRLEELTLTLRNQSGVPVEIDTDVFIEAIDEAARRIPVRKVAKGERDPRRLNFSPQGRGGPDRAGYRWRDSRDPFGPDFQWIDLSASATPVTGLSDDSVVGPLPIGFDFPFYDESFSEIYLSSNGFLSFSPIDNSGCCSGQPLPSPGSLNHLIAWAWADLHPRSSEVRYARLADGRFVLELVDYGMFATEALIDAQVILSPDGSITLQYRNPRSGFSNDLHSIGIENLLGDDGLQVSFGPDFIEDELAVQLYRGVPWIRASVPEDLLVHEAEAPVNVELLGLASLAGESRSGKFEIRHNLPRYAPLGVRVTLDTTEDQSPPEAVVDLDRQLLETNAITLSWTAPADQGELALSLSAYDLRYSLTPISESNWHEATAVPELAEPGEPNRTESYRIEGLENGREYYFALRSIDSSGLMSPLSNVLVETMPPPPLLELDNTPIALTLREGREQQLSREAFNRGGADLSLRLRLVEPPAETVVPAVSEPFLQQAKATPHRRYEKLSTLPAASQLAGLELIIRFRADSVENASLERHSLWEAERVKQMSVLNMEVWRFRDSASMESALKGLNQDPQVLFAEPNYRLAAMGVPNDARFDELWGLHNLGQDSGTLDADIDAVEAWDITTGSSEIVVAVTDTGIDYTHPDLRDNMWQNPGESANNGIDDDGNGFIDDIYGWDFADRDADPIDVDGHGTHVAGTIGARGDDGEGVVGVNHRVKLMALRFLGGSGGSTEDAISSILYAVDNGAHIINASWGGGGRSEALLDALDYARENDVLFVAAAGNSGTDNDVFPSYPASYELDNVIAVAATDRNDAIASFSQYGLTSVDLGAPGVDILSTLPNEGYDTFDGTSMASPHVAGAAALLKAYNPELRYREIRDALLEGVDLTEAMRDRTASGGRLNVLNALELVGPPWVRLTSDREALIAGGEGTALTLNFASAGLSPGTYSMNLVVTSNDPTQPETLIPITLTVEPDTEAPAAITDLDLISVDERSAVLQFTAPGDDGVSGTADRYDVRFATEAITEDNWAGATPLMVSDRPLVAGTEQRLTVTGLPASTEVWMAIVALDENALAGALSNVVTATTLEADLEIDSREFGDIRLAPGATSERTLRLRNVGSAPLSVNISAELEGTAPSAARPQFFPRQLEKGEVDLRRGAPVTLSSGGPDRAGYRWRDSRENGGPQFVWDDISDRGTAIALTRDDMVTAPISIGFDFPFYGENQTELTLSSNGFISFGNQGNGCCSGQPIPSADNINNMIAWFWIDLHPNSGRVHVLAEETRFVVQFTDYGQYAFNGSFDAQVVLYPSGDIQFFYREFDASLDLESASIGIENATGDDGLQIAFNTAFLENELAVHISMGWLNIDDTQINLAVGESQDVAVEIRALGDSTSTQRADIVIESNDSDTPVSRVPLEIIIEEE